MSSIGKVYICIFFTAFKYQESRKVHQSDVRWYSKLFALFLELTLIVFFVVQKNFHCLLLSVERKKVYMRTVKYIGKLVKGGLIWWACENFN